MRKGWRLSIKQRTQSASAATIASSDEPAGAARHGKQPKVSVGTGREVEHDGDDDGCRIFATRRQTWVAPFEFALSLSTPG